MMIDPIERVLGLLGAVRPSGKAFLARCPAHEDRRESLSVARGDDGRVLIKCFAGCATESIVSALGLEMKDLFATNGNLPVARSTVHSPVAKRDGKIVETYPYRDESGAVLFEVVRYEPKDFRQRRPDGKGGWLWNLDGVRRIPYRLPELIAAPERAVFIAEGEKDVESLEGLGLLATTNPGGSGKWGKLDPAAVEKAFRGRPVVILPDHDEPGRKHARDVAQRLLPIAGSIRIVELPGDGKDASDWIAAGGTAEELKKLARETPPFAAPPDEPAETEKPASPDDEGKAARKKSASAASMLVELVDKRAVALYRNAEGTPFADVTTSGVRRTLHLRSRAFRSWLRGEYFVETGRAVNAQAIEDALGVLEARTIVGSDIHEVHVRVAVLDGRLYLDLADDRWRAVEIDATGWRIVESPPVRFRRPAGMLPLPEPVRGGTLDDLRPLINVRDDEAWHLLVTWQTFALHPAGPFPILSFIGEQGTGKTAAARILRRLIDPNKAELCRPPREEQDMAVGAANRWVVAYDNLSSLKADLSDALCVLSTGGGLTTRKLYTDDEENIFDHKRPVILTGITEVATRPDLLDRALLVTLEPIPKDRRIPESELLARSEALRPRAIGALLDAVSGALRELPGVPARGLPRMADFARWGIGLEKALGWPEGAFLGAYDANRAEAHSSAIEASPVGPAVLGFAEERGEWSGTAGELLDHINRRRGNEKPPEGWPKTARGLGGAMRMISPALRAHGLEVTFDRGKDRRRGRAIRLLTRNINASNRPQPSATVQNDPSSPDPPEPEPPGTPEDFGRLRTVPDGVLLGCSYLDVPDTPPAAPPLTPSNTQQMKGWFNRPQSSEAIPPPDEGDEAGSLAGGREEVDL